MVKTLPVALVLGWLAPVKIGSLLITPYGGIETLAPAGARARGVFTPVETLHAGIVGLGILLHTTWTAYAEFNPGPNLRSGGAGLALALPRHQRQAQPQRVVPARTTHPRTTS